MTDSNTTATIVAIVGGFLTMLVDNHYKSKAAERSRVEQSEHDKRDREDKANQVKAELEKAKEDLRRESETHARQLAGRIEQNTIITERIEKTATEAKDSAVAAFAVSNDFNAKLLQNAGAILNLQSQVASKPPADETTEIS